MNLLTLTEMLRRDENQIDWERDASEILALYKNDDLDKEEENAIETRRNTCISC